MNNIYYCAFKMTGMSFAVLTKEEAETWVSEDPEWRYFRQLEIVSIPLPKD